MEINSVNNYSALFQDLAATQVNEIKKAAILEELGIKVATASMVADDLIMSMADNGYQMDSVIPEDSTVSYHV